MIQGNRRHIKCLSQNRKCKSEESILQLFWQNMHKSIFFCTYFKFKMPEILLFFCPPQFLRQEHLDSIGPAVEALLFFLK